MNRFMRQSIVTVVLIASMAILIAWLINIEYALLISLLSFIFLWFRQCISLQKLWRAYVDQQTIQDMGGLWGELHYRIEQRMKVLTLQNQQITEQYTHFVQAIQSSPNGVIMLGELQEIEWCNPVAEVLLDIQYSRDHLQRIGHLIRHPEFVQFLADEQIPPPLKLSAMGAQGQYTLLIQRSRYGVNSDLLIIQDISASEQLDNIRRDFVANVSHELKTPLTLLHGFLETIRDLSLTKEEQHQYIEIMLSQTQHMQQLIHTLLMLAALESKSLMAGDELVDISAILLQINEESRLLFPLHTIFLELTPTLFVRGDRADLYSALRNLVENALRYTPVDKSVRLQTRWQNMQVQVIVSDEGIGIDRVHIPRLTERFYRVDQSRSRETGGTGLGLSIVKHVLQRHQATLDIQSTKGQGSEFKIIFPTQRSNMLPEANVD